MLLSRLFQKRRPVPQAPHAASRSAPRRTRPQLFGSERLEQRLALTVSLSSTPLTGTTYCTNILIDDAVDQNGLGRDAYLQNIGGGMFRVADNPAFERATTSIMYAADSTCSTFYVASGTERDVTAGLDAAPLTGTVVGGTPTVTNLSTTSGLREGMGVSGDGIPFGTTILSMNGPTGVTLSANVDSVITSSFAFGTAALASNGTTIIGSPLITAVSSTATLLVGMPVTGPGIPANATIASIIDTTSLTLSANATAAGTAALTFGAGIKNLTGTASAGTPLISGISSTTALLIGMPVTGPGIPDNATIVSKTPTSVTLSAPSTAQRTQTLTFSAIELSGNTVAGSTTVTGLDSTLTGALRAGMLVTGANIPEGTTIRSVSNTGTSVVLSTAAFATGPDQLTFDGGVSGGSGTYFYNLPSKTLNVTNGYADLGNGLSLTFTAYPQTGSKSNPTIATLVQKPNATAWTDAGYGTPTISVEGSSLKFTFIDKDSKPKSVPAFDVSAQLAFLSPGANPQSFTVAPGLNFDQRLTVDLQPDQSRININSPWQATRGSGDDGGFYAAYGFGFLYGTSVSLFATTVNINQLTTSAAIVGVGGTQRNSGFTGPTQFLNVNATMGSGEYQIDLAGTVNSHGLLAMASQAGSFLGTDTVGSAGNIILTANYADVQFLGQVSAVSQSYLLQASGSADQYQFTTRSPATGVQAGNITGGTVVMTLGQPAGGTVDIKTQIDHFRFDSGIDASSLPYAYTVNVEETDALTVDAVGASSAPISIRAGQVSPGSLTILGSAIRTVSDLVLEATDRLTLSGPVSTGDGDVRLTSPNLAVSTTINAGGNRNVSLNSTTGPAQISALVQAGGAVKESVRVATTADIALSSLPTIDGVGPLAVGDRVLVKNQTAAAQNGIYVVAVGNWSRAADANTSALLSPGFTVAVVEGSQEGSWTFRNAAAPIVGQTGLSFVPTTASVVFNPVRLATTASNSNLSLSGAAASPLYVGTTTSTSTLVTGLTSTAGLAAGLTVLGTGNATAPTLASFNVAAATLTLSDPVTTGGSGTVLAFTTTLGVALSLGSQQFFYFDTSLLSVGMSVTGVGIPANTTILAINPNRSTVTLSASATADGYTILTFTSGVTGVTTTASAAVTNLSSTLGLALGQQVTGAGIAPGTTIASIDSATAITLSQNATSGSSGSGIALAFTGGQIDGRYVIAGDRVLVQNQAANPASNGIYIAQTGSWVRASDANTIEELRSGAYAFVTSGATNAGKGFALTTDAVQVGATPLSFQPFTVGSPGASASPRTNIWSPANVLANADIATTTTIVLSGITQTIDGVLASAGTRVLVKNQANPAENGLYRAAVGTWNRDADADTAAKLPGGTSVFVKNGTQNRNTAWNLDNSIVQTASLTKDSATVTGLFSTQALSIGMLVVGAGIPANTTIAAINGNGTSIRLSANANLPGANVPLSFISTQALTLGTSPIRFLPVGGEVAVTSGTDITGASRLQGSTAVLTAGAAPGSQAGVIDVQTNVGQVVASAPNSIKLNNAAPFELANVRTTVAGAIEATSQGSLTATVVSATGIPGAPGTIRLTSTYGDVLANTVTSNGGDIVMVAANANVLITNGTAAGTPTAANISTVGNIFATADFGKILVDGRVQASGIGNDILFSSANGTLDFTAKAVVTATDLLTINLPLSTPTVAAGASLSAAALSLTSQFGVGQSSPPTNLGTYGTVTLNRTDAGDINYTVPGNLTVAGATTTNGSIAFTAAGLTISAPLAPSGTAKDVSLTATASDLVINSAVTSGRNLALSATQGRIIDAPTAKLTVPGDITVTALSAATLYTQAGGLSATLTGSNATLVITEDDGLDIKNILFSGTNGTATLNVGSPALGGNATVGLINAGPTGSVTINSYGDIVEDVVDAGTADIVARNLTLSSSSGQIVLDIDVAVLSATTLQANKAITIRDVGTGATAGLELRSITGTGPVTVSSVGTILATSVITTGAVDLSTSDAAADILVGSVTATGNTATLHAKRSILEATPTDSGADLIAIGAVLTADTGSITLQTAIDQVTATAATAITLREDDALSLGAISAPNVSISTGFLGGNGAVTQTQPITAATSLSVTNLGNAGAVLLTNAANNAASVAISNVGRDVAYTASAGFDIATAGIQGQKIDLVFAGPVTQSGAITGSSLSVKNTVGAVSLTNPSNNVATVAIDNTGRPVTYADSNGFDVGIVGLVTGIKGSVVTLSAAGDLTQTAAILATTSLSVTNTAGVVTLTNAANDALSVAIANAGRVVSYTDANDFGIAAAGIQGSTITLAAGGNLSQVGSITGMSLAVTNSAGTVTLTNAANDVGSLAISNAGRGISYSDASAFGIVAPGIQGSVVALTAGGNLTQTAAIVATTSLTITNTAGAVTLTTAANDALSLAISNPGRVVSYSDISGFDIAAAGIQGSPITLIAAGAVTQTGAISGGALAVTTTSGSVTLTNAANDVSSLAIANPGRQVSYRDASGFDIAAAGLQGAPIALTAAGAITQSGAITSTGVLSLTNTSGAITLTNANNDVASLTASNGSGALSYVDKSALTITGITAGDITLGTVDTLTVSNPIVAGSATPPGVKGDGNITLTSTAASILINANLTALKDTVTLNATAGTITQNPTTTIASESLVWYALTPPTFSASNTSVVLGLNLTGPGNIVFSNPTQSITVATSSTVDGSIYIDAPGVHIAGPLTAGGSGSEVVVTSTLGNDITFDAAGSITNALGSGGVTLTAGGSIIDLHDPGTDITALSATLTATAGSIGTAANPLETSVSSLTATANSVGAVINVTNDQALALKGLSATGTNGAILLQNAGAITQTSGGITATSLAVTNSSGAVTLTSASNDVTSLAIFNAGRAVSYTDSNGFDIAAAGIQGSAITLGAGGNLTQTGSITGTSLAVNNTAGAVTLTNAANDVSSLAIANGSRAVSYTDAGGFDIAAAGIQGSPIVLNAAGAVTQTGAITGGALSVTNTSGTVRLSNAANDVTSLSIANAGRAVFYADATGFDIAAAGIQGSAITLGAGGNLSQTGAITGTSLAVTNTAGSVTLTNAANNVSSLAIANAGRAVSYIDVSGFDIMAAGIQGSPIGLFAAGAVTQTGAITGGALAVTNTSGAVTLTNVANDVTSLSIANAGNAVSYTDATGFDIATAGIQGSNIALGAGGNLTQTGSVAGTSLAVTNTAGTVTLTNAANDVNSLTIANASRVVSYTDASGFDIGAAGIQGSAIALNAGGNLTQTGSVTGTSLAVTNSAGSVTLTSPGNDVSSLSIANATRAVSYADSSGFDIAAAGIQGNPIALGAAGALTQTGAVTGASLAVTNTAGTVTLTNAANDVSSLAIANAGRPVSYTDSTGFDIAASGIQGSAITLGAGGNLTQTGVLSGATLAVNNSAGTVTLTNSANDISSLSIANGNRAVSYTDATGYDVAGLTGGTVALRANGNLTQSGVITATSLNVTNNGSDIALYTRANNVGTFSATNGSGSVLFQNGATPLTLAGITGGYVYLNVAGSVSETAPIVASTLTVGGSGEQIALHTQVNQVGTFSANNGLGTILFQGPSTPLSLGPVTGGYVYIQANGEVTESGAIIAQTLAVGGVGSPLSLASQNNQIGTFNVSNGLGSVTLKDTTGSLVVGYAYTGPLTLQAAGPVTQTGVIYATALSVSSNGSAINLGTQANRIDSFTTSNGQGDVSINDTSGNLLLAAINGGKVAVQAAGTVTQSAPINATSLAVTGVGQDIVLYTQTNNVGTFSATNGSGTVLFQNGSGPLALGPITGGYVYVQTGGSASQAGAISAQTLTFGGAGSPLVLNTQNNQIGTFNVSNGLGAVSIKDTAGDLVIGYAYAGPLTIQAAGPVGQTGAIYATALNANATGSSVSLDTQANQIDSFASSNGSGAISIKDTSGNLSLGAITGGNVAVTTAGYLSQSAPINAASLAITGSGQDIALYTQVNNVGTFSAINGAGAVMFQNGSGALTVGPTTGGYVYLQVGGSLSQVFNAAGGHLGMWGPGITATTLTVGGAGQAINMGLVENQIGTFNVSNGPGDVSFRDTSGDLSLGYAYSGALNVKAAGTVSVSQAIAGGNVQIATPGSLVVGPAGSPTPLLKSSTLIDLTGVQGDIAIANGGLIVAPSVQTGGKPIQIAGIDSVAALNSAVSLVNSQPGSTGLIYQLTVTQSLVLTQTLIVSNPIVLQGITPSTTLYGSNGVPNGLYLTGAANGSTVRDIAFGSFNGGTAVTLNAVKNVTMTNVSIGNSTNGLYITGDSTGTNILSNKFVANQTGISLVYATNVTVGGLTSGSNSVSYSARAAVFASGNCVGSKVLKTVMSNNAVDYDVSASRNLTVVK